MSERERDALLYRVRHSMMVLVSAQSWVGNVCFGSVDCALVPLTKTSKQRTIPMCFIVNFLLLSVK